MIGSKIKGVVERSSTPSGGTVEEAEDILEYESEEKLVEIFRDSHRWWDQITYVGKYGDKFFEFTTARTTRDMTARDCGWEFDWDDVVEVEPYVEVVEVIKYKRV